jgi:hypothetical protein
MRVGGVNPAFLEPRLPSFFTYLLDVSYDFTLRVYLPRRFVSFSSPQQDLVRNTGMRAVRQACGATFEEVEEFLRGESFPVVR